MSKFVAYRSPIKTYISLAFILIFSVFGVFGKSDQFGETEAAVLAMKVVFGLIMLGLFIQICRKGFDTSAPVLRVDSRGVLWTRWSSEAVPWRHIRDFREVRADDEKCIAVWLTSDAPRDKHLSARFARLFQTGPLFSSCDFTLSVVGTDGAYNDLLKAMMACKTGH